jgi:hypothetical protein
MWFGGVDAVFNARGLVCGCVNGAWKFTPHARVMYLENKQTKSRMIYGWINSARYKLTKAIGFGEGEVQLGRLGRITLAVGGVWNAWVYMCFCQPHPP